nr:uncharacterized protein LOC111426101 [Onthophagus taurus]
MKYLLVFLFIGVSYATPASNLTNSTTITEDLNDIMEVIPIEKIKRIALEHLHNDLEFQAAVQYMKGPEWSALMKELNDQPQFQKLYTFLKDTGLNLEKVENLLCGFMKDVNVSTNHTVKSFKKFVEDVRKVIPLASVIEVVDNKLRTSQAFNDFYGKISGTECFELIQEVRKLPIYKQVVDGLKSMDIDIEAMLRLVSAIFNWEMTPLEKLASGDAAA